MNTMPVCRRLPAMTLEIHQPADTLRRRCVRAAALLACCIAVNGSAAATSATEAATSGDALLTGAPSLDPYAATAWTNDGQAGGAPGALPPEADRRLGSWEKPAIVVEGSRLSPLREEDLIGGYLQPRWTAHRRFPATRVYVAPEGQVDAEQWFRWEDKRDATDELVTQTEIEFGLPRRLQLDLYLIQRHEHEGPTNVDNAIEMRYAFADWGRLWGNPTVYLEWISQERDPDKVEAKLLFGDQIAAGWHWGTNLVWEGETGGARVHELEWTAAISHTVIDEKFSWGLETKFAWEDEAGARGDYTEDLRVGPSFQYRPLPQMHVDFAPLFGITHESKRSDVFLVLGYEF